jgi:hypothetical protein
MGQQAPFGKLRAGSRVRVAIDNANRNASLGMTALFLGRNLQGLLQAFDQVKIGEHAVVAEGAGFAVWSDQDWTDRFHPGWI